MARSNDEWIGKTDDASIPDRVRVRVFERHKGICHWTKRKIAAGEPWDCDHVQALINGGEHRESNLAPILRGKPHKEKTAQDVAVKKKTAAIRKRHLGLSKPKSRGFSKPSGMKFNWSKGRYEREATQ